MKKGEDAHPMSNNDDHAIHNSIVTNVIGNWLLRIPTSHSFKSRKWNSSSVFVIHLHTQRRLSCSVYPLSHKCNRNKLNETIHDVHNSRVCKRTSARARDAQFHVFHCASNESVDVLWAFDYRVGTHVIEFTQNDVLASIICHREYSSTNFLASMNERYKPK